MGRTTEARIDIAPNNLASARDGGGIAHLGTEAPVNPIAIPTTSVKRSPTTVLHLAEVGRS